jgi:hypothetical protein
MTSVVEVEGVVVERLEDVVQVAAALLPEVEEVPSMAMLRSDMIYHDSRIES